MRARRGRDRERELCSGPGKLTQALAIGLDKNGSDLSRGPVVITKRPKAFLDPLITVSRRVGITRAEDLPWRFSLRGSRFLSAPERR
jgi:DNA-3-methyladenine glycosylase